MLNPVSNLYAQKIGTTENDHHFDPHQRTEEGHIKVLERFSKRSRILQGIENYRLAILEANPSTFVVPINCDAESVLIVVGGLLWCRRRKSRTPRDKLVNLFRQQKKGVIIRASQEQKRALTQQSGFEKGESWRPFNPLKKLPLFSIQFGQFFEVSPNDYEKLKDLDLSVSYMNIKKVRT
ncbi:Vicilin-like antimicrobial peptides 2-3 [Forsythia ovata]|uniref:Vicilin-like antimicrobial peptides 2-3 n=1 Tax=Forsythia ovata TaxID=205694 RepID=A0ABD1T876_9LAMI